MRLWCTIDTESMYSHACPRQHGDYFAQCLRRERDVAVAVVEEDVQVPRDQGLDGRREAATRHARECFLLHVFQASGL
jgi:hypothetical protein